MELVFFLLFLGVVGILAVLYFLNVRDDERVTLKAAWGGTSTGDSGDGPTYAAAKLYEGMSVNANVPSPKSRAATTVTASSRKQTAKPAAKRPAAVKAPVNTKKKDPNAPVRRRTRP